MSEIHVLVVDDEKEIADLVEIYLVSDGYKVYKASNALEGLEILEKETIHLVLLDIMMPGMDGLEMCRKIRETNNIPIIMLSARSADLDKILGLGTGADDYVTKPFNPLELTARVKSQLRRYTQLNPQSGAGNQVKNEISIKGLTINKDNHKVTVYGEEIKLTPIEFDILYLLASNPGRVFSMAFWPFGLQAVLVQMRDEMVQQQQKQDAQPKACCRREKRQPAQICSLFHGWDQQTPHRCRHHHSGGKAGQRPLDAVAQGLF